MTHREGLLALADRIERADGKPIAIDPKAAEALRASLDQSPLPAPKPRAWLWRRDYPNGGYAEQPCLSESEARELAKDGHSLPRPDSVIALYDHAAPLPALAGEREAGRVMMSAHALCPIDMPHPQRMQWMADYFLANASRPTTQAPADNSALLKKLEHFVSFLCGAAEIEGASFDERPRSSEYQGAFWWRTPLRTLEKELAAALATTQAPAEPALWQWRRKGEPWSKFHTYLCEVFATTDDSEVRVLYAAPPTPVEVPGANVNSCDVRDTTYDTPLPVFYDRATALPVEALAPSDEQIAEAMLAVDDPLLWGRLGEGQGDMVRKFARALFAIAPPAVLVEPAGWVLVPIEPTEAMVNAMRKAWQEAVDRDADDECRAEYRAAIAAAPSVPQGVTKQPAPDSYLKGSGE